MEHGTCSSLEIEFPSIDIINMIELFTDLFYLIYMGVLPVCMAAPCVYCCSWSPDESMESPEAGVRDGCEPLRRCWESNLSQPVL